MNAQQILHLVEDKVYQDCSVFQDLQDQKILLSIDPDPRQIMATFAGLVALSRLADTHELPDDLIFLHSRLQDLHQWCLYYRKNILQEILEKDKIAHENNGF